MLDLIICGVPEVNDYIDNVDGIISIMNPAWRIYAPQSIDQKKEENRHNVLELEFDDVWAENVELGQELISKDILYEVLDFADNFRDKYGEDGTLLIHCHEGISRSSAIALTILTYLTDDVSEAIEIVNDVRPQAMPNIEVIRVADDILKLEGEFIHQVVNFFYF
ncbi:dual specificity protein phosphatase family protein (plasmid) [Cyanobacterium sp. IPPAS B-1200]|uniref:dual specificity protein phosphatase family protein n=1 Tax=Cyanobacterium sp. IPPAS B-1200 TaxID=1562720 RepID=UPI00085277EB|nr:dual specificity protein phosphatase family protein [Cyanobacterium sp. IPPAS B-1200]OEJ80002.1 hypothetical protein A5482_07655 [Cyanobacterium sp. IPPAS B-1200]